MSFQPEKRNVLVALDANPFSLKVRKEIIRKNTLIVAGLFK